MMFLLLLEKPDNVCFYVNVCFVCITVYFKVAMMSMTEMCGQ